MACRLVLVVVGDGAARFTNPDTGSYVRFTETFPRILWDPDAAGLVRSLQRTPGYPTLLWLVSGTAPVQIT